MFVMNPRMRSQASWDSLGVVLRAAVEEGVRGAFVDLDRVLDGERRRERVDLILRDVVVGAAEQAEDRNLGVGRAVDRPAGQQAAARQDPVEADDPGEPVVTLGGLDERHRAAEAEADGDRPLDPGLLLEELQRGGDVQRDRLGRGLPDVRHVLEVLVARAEPGRAAEVVQRDRRVAGLGEALGELLVEAEQAADVGQHDDAGRALGAREVRGEVGAVGAGQGVALTGRAAGHHLKSLGQLGDDRVERKAHSAGNATRVGES